MVESDPSACTRARVRACNPNTPEYLTSDRVTLNYSANSCAVRTTPAFSAEFERQELRSNTHTYTHTHAVALPENIEYLNELQWLIKT